MIKYSSWLWPIWLIICIRNSLIALTCILFHFWVFGQYFTGVLVQATQVGLSCRPFNWPRPIYSPVCWPPALFTLRPLTSAMTSHHRKESPRCRHRLGFPTPVRAALPRDVSVNPGSCTKSCPCWAALKWTGQWLKRRGPRWRPSSRNIICPPVQWQLTSHGRNTHVHPAVQLVPRCSWCREVSTQQSNISSHC